MTNIRQLITTLEAGLGVSEALVARAHGELLELEKTRDILVISTFDGHWTVPFTELTLKELVQAADADVGSSYLLQLVKGRGGKELLNTKHHTTSFYSHVVIFK